MNKNKLILLFAQGFGTGLSPLAPGTCGSFLGIAWFALLLSFENFWIFLGGQLASFIVSIWLCGKAEVILKKSDPGSVVLDEIVALPLCFSAPVCIHLFQDGVMPVLSDFFTLPTVWITVLGFLLFRFFDVLKPWPVNSSQRLPSGLGITADDLLAGGYTTILLGGVYWLWF
ncbi:MAG: phosphatidylglycerophosphatase A [Verrucomicrobia bacterium]|jgi:phosphatidylglycerophosphatase A|nr:phosphatidylglycerophosphatase A [Verrucomicrobiota bacterium]